MHRRRVLCIHRIVYDVIAKLALPQHLPSCRILYLNCSHSIFIENLHVVCG